PLQRETEPDRLHDVRLVVHDQDLHSSPRSAGARGGARRGEGPARRAPRTRTRRRPRAGGGATSMVPPCASAIASEIGSPSPVPDLPESLAEVKNRSKRRAPSSGAMAGPRSL